MRRKKLRPRASLGYVIATLLASVAMIVVVAAFLSDNRPISASKIPFPPRHTTVVNRQQPKAAQADVAAPLPETLPVAGSTQVDISLAASDGPVVADLSSAIIFGDGLGSVSMYHPPGNPQGQGPGSAGFSKASSRSGNAGRRHGPAGGGTGTRAGGADRGSGIAGRESDRVAPSTGASAAKRKKDAPEGGQRQGADAGPPAPARDGAAPGKTKKKSQKSGPKKPKSDNNGDASRPPPLHLADNDPQGKPKMKHGEPVSGPTAGGSGDAEAEGGDAIAPGSDDPLSGREKPKKKPEVSEAGESDDTSSDTGKKPKRKAAVEEPAEVTIALQSEQQPSSAGKKPKKVRQASDADESDQPSSVSGKKPKRKLVPEGPEGDGVLLEDSVELSLPEQPGNPTSEGDEVDGFDVSDAGNVDGVPEVDNLVTQVVAESTDDLSFADPVGGEGTTAAQNEAVHDSAPPAETSSLQAIAEPPMFALFAFGVLGLVELRRRKNRTAASLRES